MKINLRGRKGLRLNCFFEYSNSQAKHVFSRKEIDNVLPSSKIWWRGRSYAASVASDVPEPQKDRRRVPKEARRVLIESFVDEYKALNAGNFPSASHTQKQVGGSYYVVRNILQELQKKSSMPSYMSRGEKSVQQKTVNETDRDTSNSVGKHLEPASDRQMSSACAETTASADNVKHNLLENDPDAASSTSHKEPYKDRVEDKEDVDSSGSVYIESPMSEVEQVAVSDTRLESKSSSQELKYDGPNHEEERFHNANELERVKNMNVTAEDGEFPTTSKRWGNIKSIIDSIVNIWRNR